MRFGLLPLRQIEQGLAAIRSGERRTLEGELPAEIEPLQPELNALIQSNQDIVERARTQVGNLAHALKTPLAVITNEARGRQDRRSRDKVAEQAEIMRDQVNHYLDRARMAARVGVIGRVTEVRAGDRADRARAASASTATRASSSRSIARPSARFQGEKQDLEEMLGNLLDNACKWARREVVLTRRAAAVDQHGRAARRLSITRRRRRPGPQRRAARDASASAACGSTRPSPAPASASPSSPTSPTPIGGTCELAQAPQGGLAVHLTLPAG